MDPSTFITVGENLHCSRTVKRGGAVATVLSGGGEGIKFTHDGAERVLPVPAGWEAFSPAYADGKVKHVTLAIHLTRTGKAEAQQAGLDYLRHLADRQIAAGAKFLDVNVDEYSPDPDENVKAMAFVAGFLSRHCATPLSIDSSNPKLIAAGLAECRTDLSSPMVNSVSLERPELLDLVKHHGADVVVSAFGRTDLPEDAAARLANFREILALADAAGLARSRLHLDALVVPISTGATNGTHFLEAVALAAAEFPGTHRTGGLSNVSYGMPCRRLLNLVFVRLAIEAGVDGGIVDPTAMPVAEILAQDPASTPFKMARAVLTGEDPYGMEFIVAYREGKLG